MGLELWLFEKFSQAKDVYDIATKDTDLGNIAIKPLNVSGQGVLIATWGQSADTKLIERIYYLAQLACGERLNPELTKKIEQTANPLLAMEKLKKEIGTVRMRQRFLH